ncbi:hypothetical protein Taro_020090 [Colocasia esculenta]|uniref:Uncharacterized protein n=1 Tax=Colocasia esculenta TaxID=4460 RepID=A0A843UVH5_COLES|nr:hypothetical protein [Colocasia esculenta]
MYTDKRSVGAPALRPLPSPRARAVEPPRPRWSLPSVQHSWTTSSSSSSVSSTSSKTSRDFRLLSWLRRLDVLVLQSPPNRPNLKSLRPRTPPASSPTILGSPSAAGPRVPGGGDSSRGGWRAATAPTTHRLCAAAPASRRAVGASSSHPRPHLAWRITGSIPPSLGKLPKLQAIFLDRNLLTGTIPESIGLLHHPDGLYIRLSHNNLTGPVPQSFKGSNISQIDLSRNQLTGDPSVVRALNIIQNCWDSFSSDWGSTNILRGTLQNFQGPKLEILIRLASGLFQHGRADECDLWKLTEFNSDS